MIFKISLPYRKPITSIKHEDLLEILEPYLGRNQKPPYFAGADWGPGWDDIILDLHNKLVEEHPDYFIVQIKEKFSTLRYYVSEMTDQGYIYIAQAENKSAETCEECGRPGRLRNGSWIRTLCDWDHNVVKVNMFTTRIRRFPYIIYWKVRFVVNRWRRKRNGSAKK